MVFLKQLFSSLKYKLPNSFLLLPIEMVLSERIGVLAVLLGPFG